jgi:hypothetical protein
MTLARSMLRAAMKAGVSEYSPYQLRELAAWKSDLDRLQAGLVTMIQAYLQLRLSKHTRTSNQNYVDACAALLRAEQRERSAGTAKLRKSN